MIKVLVNGCNGKMGNSVVRAIENDQSFFLVAKTGSSDNLESSIATARPDVVIDFTTPTCAYENALTTLSHSVHAIIGTTGISPEQRDTLRQIAVEKKVGILIAPNFCFGAVLMMKFAAEASKYLPNVEIIEYHHDHKADAPSGTAITTAEYINKNNGLTNVPAVKSKEMLNETSQGALVGNIRIHAVRLPGYVASQEVLLGDSGQTLKIRHDTIDREAFMPGIVFATKSIINKVGLYYGLETILFET